MGHIGIARWLAAILDVGQLKPQRCSVFKKKLLYLSYGGLFYRSHRLQTENATELPIGLIFSPRGLRKVAALFPFDSGAIARHPRLQEWRDKMHPFDRFRVDTADALSDTAELVRVLYKTNQRYLRGQVAAEASSGDDPLPLLASFLSADLTPEIDHRQRSIECVAEKAFPLTQDLLWFGFPDRNRKAVIKKLHEWTAPDVPVTWPYPYTRNFNPAELAGKLEQRAYDDVVKRYAELSR